MGNSIFSISDYSKISKEHSADQRISGFQSQKNLIKRKLPKLHRVISSANPLRLLYRRDFFSTNLSAEKCFDKFADLMLRHNSLPVVLVVGAGTQGRGMGKIISNESIRFIIL